MSIPECLEAPLDAGITSACLIRMGYEEGDAVALTPTIYRLMELAYIAQEQLYIWADPRDDDPLSAAMQKDLASKKDPSAAGKHLGEPRLERVPLFRTVFQSSISDGPCGFMIMLPR